MTDAPTDHSESTTTTTTTATNMIKVATIRTGYL